MISQTPFRPTCLSDLSDGTTVLVKWPQIERPVSERPEQTSSLAQLRVQCSKGSSSGAGEVLTGVLCSLRAVFRYNTDSRQTCANNRHQCSVHAECRDFATGFCCRCVAGYTGNGRQCVAEGTVSLILFKGEKREEWFCFGACFEILPLPRSLKVGGVFSWAVIFHLSFLILACISLWG